MMIGRTCGAVVAGLVVVLATPAQARITVTRADYKAGILVVHGHTNARLERVTLDGRYNKWTDAKHQFRFRLRYLPRDCHVRIKTGNDERRVRVAGCEPLSKPRRYGRPYGSPQR